MQQDEWIDDIRKLLVWNYSKHEIILNILKYFNFDVGGKPSLLQENISKSWIRIFLNKKILKLMKTSVLFINLRKNFRGKFGSIGYLNYRSWDKMIRRGEPFLSFCFQGYFQLIFCHLIIKVAHVTNRIGLNFPNMNLVT